VEKVKTLPALNRYIANIKDIELFHWKSKVDYDKFIKSSYVRHG